VVAALSLATDLRIGVPFEHGLQSTLYAMRLAARLGVDSETASQTYYACLLFYVGCTADADVAAETFGDDDALTRYATPVVHTIEKGPGRTSDRTSERRCKPALG
jgi:hypothetical protein